MTLLGGIVNSDAILQFETLRLRKTDDSGSEG